VRGDNDLEDLREQLRATAFGDSAPYPVVAAVESGSNALHQQPAVECVRGAKAARSRGRNFHTKRFLPSCPGIPEVLDVSIRGVDSLPRATHSDKSGREGPAIAAAGLGDRAMSLAAIGSPAHTPLPSSAFFQRGRSAAAGGGERAPPSEEVKSAPVATCAQPSPAQRVAALQSSSCKKFRKWKV
jgi:hypothetical protein